MSEIARAGVAYVEVVGDFSKLRRQLATEMAGRGQDKIRVGVDFDDRGLKAFKRTIGDVGGRVRRKPIIQKLGTEYDNSGVREFRRDVDDTNRSLGRQRAAAVGAGGGINALGKSFKKVTPDMFSFTTRIPIVQLGVMGIAGYNAAGGIIALGGALAPLSGLLGAVGPLATAAAQGINTIKLATAGVGDAISSAFAEQDKAATASTGSLQAQEAAVEGVRQAQLSLGAAHRTARDAQESLTLARADATREIEDMKAAVRDLALEEEGASLSLKEAKQAFAELAESGAGELEIERASLRIREAREELRKTREESRRTSKDLGAVEAGGGVKGMPQVVAARRSLADANRGVVEAEKQVALAIRQSAQAMQATSGAADTLKSKMDALSPPARRFAEFIIGLRPQLKRLQGIAAAGLFPGVEKGITSAMQNLPVLEGIIARTSKALGALAEQAGRRLGSQEWGKDLEVQGKRNETTITRLGQAGLNLAEAFKDVTLAAGPLVSRLTKWILALTEGWKESANASRESGRLQRFFKDAGDTFFKTVRILRDLGVAFKNIGSAARQAFGNELLGNIAKGARNLREWTGSVRGQRELVSVFEDIGDNLKAVGRFVRDLVGDFRQMKQAGMTTGEALGHIFTQVFVGAITEALEAGPKIAAALVKGFFNADALGKLVGGALLISKFGGFAAWQAIFRKVGLSSGAAMGAGVAQGAATTTGKLLPGALAKHTSKFRAVGRFGIGAALAVGIGAAMTDPREGIGNRVQNALSGLSLGIIPATKSIGERLSSAIESALKGGSANFKGFSQFLDQLDDNLPAAEKRIIGRLTALRQEAVRLFGKDTKLKLDVAADPAQALKDIRSISRGIGGLNNLFDTVGKHTAGVLRIATRDIRLIGKRMGFHTKEGADAVRDNFRAARRAIENNLRHSRGSSEDAFSAIKRIAVTSSKAVSSTTAKNFADARNFVRDALTDAERKSGRGLKRIKELWVAELSFYGYSKGQAIQILKAKKDKGKGSASFHGPQDFGARGGLVSDIASGARNYAKGGLVQFGQQGAAGRDNIPVQFGQQQVAVGSGEVGAVFNRHQLPVLNARLADMGGLPGFFNKFDRKHYAARGGVFGGLKGFASGGFIDDEDAQIAGHPSEPALERDRRNLRKAKAQQRAILKARRRRRKRRARELRELRWDKYGDPNEGPQAASLGGLIERFAKGGLIGMMAAARKLDKAQFPYLWGGGHSGTPAPFGPMDCSGAVSYVLQQGGVKIPTMVSGALASAGQPGPGQVTVFADPGHTFMRIGDRYFGTSGTNPGGGAGFFPDPGASYKSRFTQRHFVGGAVGGASEIPRVGVTGPDGGPTQLVQRVLDAGRGAANAALAKLSGSVIGSGDVGDPGPAGDYSKDRLKKLWIAAGGPASVANLAAAVALAESGGRSDASNTNNNGSIDRGLWQINSIHGDLSTFDPEANARAAVKISSSGSNWNPWVAYKSGTHRQYLAKGGTVGYVGDSLGVGTAPKLKGRIGDLVANVAESRTSAQGLKVLKGMLGSKYARYIWDLGTNDGDAGAVKSNLKAADKATGDRLLLASTVTGANAKAKNSALRALAGGDINLFEWAKRSKGILEGGDVHPPDGAAYGKRAAMMAGALSAATSRHKGKGKDQGKLPKLKGSLTRKARQTAKALANNKDKKRRAKILNRFKKHLKKYGLPNKLLNKINFQLAAHDRFLSFADAAEGADVTDDETGVTTRGLIQGKNLGDWLAADLDAMFGARNSLIKAKGIVTVNQKKVERTFKWVSELLKGYSKDGKTPRKWEGVNPAKDPVEKWNKQPGPKRHKRMKAWRDKQGKLPGTREFNTFTGKVSEVPKSKVEGYKTLKGKLKNQNTLLTGALSEDSDTGIASNLEMLQGFGPPQILKSPWPRGTIWGGDILSTQDRILDLFAVPPKTTDDTTAADDARVPLLEQLLREANLRTSISERQFDVLRNFPPFGGQFATGGVVPGPAGAPRTVIAHGGETIVPEGKGGAPAPNVYVNLDGNLSALRGFVTTTVKQDTRKMASGRPMPGRAGGGR